MCLSKVNGRLLCSLKRISIYECDSELIAMLNFLAADSLELLAVGKLWQDSDHVLDLKRIQYYFSGMRPHDYQPHCLGDLVNKYNGLFRGVNVGSHKVKGFSKIERLSFCPTWNSFTLEREIINEQNDATIAITGNRDIEAMFFGMRAELLEIHLGEWVYDDLLIYISEICKELEIIEINSTLITDLSVAHLLKKVKHLRSLDLSGCP